MKHRSVQKSLYPLEQMPFNEWLKYISREANKAENESFERLQRKIKRQKIDKAVQSRKANQIGTRKVILSARSIISN